MKNRNFLRISLFVSSVDSYTASDSDEKHAELTLTFSVSFQLVDRTVRRLSILTSQIDEGEANVLRIEPTDQIKQILLASFACETLREE